MGKTIRIMGENIKNLRKSKGLTREDLASRLSVCVATISGWENKGKFPGYDMLERLAKIFGVQVFNLFMEGFGEGAVNISEPANDMAKFLNHLNAILTSEAVIDFEETPKCGYKISIDPRICDDAFRNRIAYIAELARIKKGDNPIKDHLYLVGLKNEIEKAKGVTSWEH